MNAQITNSSCTEMTERVTKKLILSPCLLSHSLWVSQLTLHVGEAKAQKVGEVLSSIVLPALSKRYISFLFLL